MDHSQEQPAPSPNDVVVVVPCYNAGPSVRSVAERLLDLASNIIVVDDGSTDGCVEPLRSLPLRIIAFPENRGKGHALLAGYKAALEDPEVQCVASLDADGQHDPAELPGLIEAFRREKADLLIGSRDFTRGETPWRSRFGNRLTVFVVGRLLKRHLPDTQSGYRLLSRSFLQSVLPTIQGGRYETEMELLVKAITGGHNVIPVPIKTIYAKGNPSSHFNAVRDSFRIYTTLLRTLRQ